MIDFWKDYDGTNSDSIPHLRVDANKHSWWHGSWEYSGLDVERIKAYCKATSKDFHSQTLNAEFMNTMEDWYLNLAERMKLHQVDYSGDGYSDGHIIYDTAFCPSCGYEYEEDDKDWNEPFCPHCGARLDWSMINEQT